MKIMKPESIPAEPIQVRYYPDDPELVRMALSEAVISGKVANLFFSLFFILFASYGFFVLYDNRPKKESQTSPPEPLAISHAPQDASYSDVQHDRPESNRI